MIGHLLNGEYDVYRTTYAADGAGGRTPTEAAVGSIRAQTSQPTDQERFLAQQAGARLDYVVHTTPGADVERGDELDNGGARRLRVVAVVQNSRATYKRLHCAVVQGE